MDTSENLSVIHHYVDSVSGHELSHVVTLRSLLDAIAKWIRDNKLADNLRQTPNGWALGSANDNLDEKEPEVDADLSQLVCSDKLLTIQGVNEFWSNTPYTAQQYSRNNETRCQPANIRRLLNAISTDGSSTELRRRIGMRILAQWCQSRREVLMKGCDAHDRRTTTALYNEIGLERGQQDTLRYHELYGRVYWSDPIFMVLLKPQPKTSKQSLEKLQAKSEDLIASLKLEKKERIRKTILALETAFYEKNTAADPSTDVEILQAQADGSHHQHISKKRRKTDQCNDNENQRTQTHESHITTYSSGTSLGSGRAHQDTETHAWNVESSNQSIDGSSNQSTENASLLEHDTHFQRGQSYSAGPPTLASSTFVSHDSISSGRIYQPTVRSLAYRHAGSENATSEQQANTPQQPPSLPNMSYNSHYWSSFTGDLSRQPLPLSDMDHHPQNWFNLNEGRLLTTQPSLLPDMAYDPQHWFDLNEGRLLTTQPSLLPDMAYDPQHWFDLNEGRLLTTQPSLLPDMAYDPQHWFNLNDDEVVVTSG